MDNDWMPHPAGRGTAIWSMSAHQGLSRTPEKRRPLPDTPGAPRPPALGACLLAPPRPPRPQEAGGRHRGPVGWSSLEGTSSLKASPGLLWPPGTPCLSPTPGLPLSPP